MRWEWRLKLKNLEKFDLFESWWWWGIYLGTKNNLLLCIARDDTLDTNSWFKMWGGEVMTIFHFYDLIDWIISLSLALNSLMLVTRSKYFVFLVVHWWIIREKELTFDAKFKSSIKTNNTSFQVFLEIFFEWNLHWFSWQYPISHFNHLPICILEISHWSKE